MKFVSSLFTRASRLTPHPSLLLAWVLLVPQSGAPHNISFADKLRTWVEAGEADTQAGCGEGREPLKLSSAIGPGPGARERLKQGIRLRRAPRRAEGKKRGFLTGR